MGARDTEFGVDKLYYQIESVTFMGRIVRIVSTWTYDGSLATRRRVRGAHDRGREHFFSRFIFDRSWRRSSRKRRFRTLEAAHGSMRSWNELCVQLPREQDILDARCHAGQGTLAELPNGEAIRDFTRPFYDRPAVESGKFRLGHPYYCFSVVEWYRRTEPVVETWIYSGAIRSRCGSRYCDVANWKYRFWPLTFSDGQWRLGPKPHHYPRLRDAESGFRSWEELLAGIPTLNDTLAQERSVRKQSHKMAPGFALVTPYDSDDALSRLAKRSELEGLTVYAGRITSPGLAVIEQLINLKAVSLNGKRIGDAELRRLGSLPCLESLLLQHTGVGDQELAHLARLANLKSLVISRSPVTGAGLVHLAGLTSLTALHLREVTLSDEALQHITNLTRLVVLVLSAAELTDAAARHISGLSNLEVLDLSHNRLTDACLPHIAVLLNLKHLNIHGANVTAAGLRHLRPMVNLEHINLWGTQVGDEALDTLAKLKNLKYVNLRSTSVSDGGVRKLQEALPSCRVHR